MPDLWRRDLEIFLGFANHKVLNGENILHEIKQISTIGNLKISKPRFINKCPVFPTPPKLHNEIG